MNAGMGYVTRLSLCLIAFEPAVADTLSGVGLVRALQRGGYILVMRHASSPRDKPTPQAANPDNPNHEWQLDETGRTTAIAMGGALRELKIPIGEVFTIPTYRAMQTVRLAQLPHARPIDELGDGGQSMQGITDLQAQWLRDKAKDFSKGSNVFIVTHFPNITRAFPQWSTGLSDGEALVLGPDGRGGVALVARIKIQEWGSLDAGRSVTRKQRL